jgi:autotransporter-associated beta strand protein
VWDTNTASWDAGVRFTNNNGAVFGGADGALWIQCFTNLSATNLTFSASGYTLTNDVLTTISVPANNGSVMVATGKSATIGTNVTVSGGGNPFLFNPGIASAGTLIIDGGTLQQQNNQPFNFDGAPGSAIRVLTGGTLRHGGNGSNLRVGLTAGSSPVISIEGGRFICDGGSSFGSIILSAANSSTSAVTIASGVLSNAFTGNSTYGSLTIGYGNPSQATVDLNGGVLAVGNIRKATAAAVGILNLNGGTLKSVSSSAAASFLPALAGLTVNVRNGASTFDNNGNSVTLSQPFLHSTVAGDNATDGGITFVGAGITTLTATNTYTGATVVATGSTLSLGAAGQISASSALSVNGTLSLSNRTFWNDAAFFGITNGTLLLNCVNFPTNLVVGTLATGGSANQVSFSAITGAGSIPQATPIIKYSALAAGVVDEGNNLTALSLGSLPAGFAGHLTNNTTKKTIDLVLTAGSLQPQFVVQPVSVTRYKGFTVQLAASVIGATSLRWQTNSGSSWGNVNDGGNINGAASNILTISNLSLAQAGSYQLVANNSSGASTSSVITVTVLDIAGYGGTNALLAPLAYYRLNETGDPINTANLPAADVVGGIDGVYGSVALNSAYGITGPQPPDFPGFETGNGAVEITAGYNNSWVVVSNSWPINTNTVTLAAWIYPKSGQNANAGIVVQRGGAAVSCGLTYSSSTNSLGSYTLGYNWNNDGNAYLWDSGLIPPAGQWSLVALVVTPTNATIYLGNTNGLALSKHTMNHVVQSFPGPIYFGADPFAVSRNFNGDVDEVSVFGRSLSTDELTVLLGAAVGTTNFPPSFTAQPPAQVTNYQYQTQTITAQAYGAGALGYQWQKVVDSTYQSLADDGRITGTTNSILSISNLSLTDTANYVLVVTNSFGSVTSTVAHLTVNPVLGAATTIATTVSQSAGSDWDTASTWSIDGTLQAAGATLLAQEYSSGPGLGSTFVILPGGAMRTPAFSNPNSATSATFPGDVLKVQGDGTFTTATTTTGSLRIKGGNPATVNFKKLVLDGGQLVSILNSGWKAIVDGGELNVLSDSVVWASDDSGAAFRSFDIKSRLTGAGRVLYCAYTSLTTFQSGAGVSLNIANATNTFTGTWDVRYGALVGSAPNALGTNSILVESQGALQTTYDIQNPNSDLVLNGFMFLTQNDTFRTVTINGVGLAAGTHSYAELAAAFPTNFPATWVALNGAAGATTAAGSITVLAGPAAPADPGVIHLAAGGATGLQLTWTNASTLLLTSTNVLGPWVTNLGATSPFPVTNDVPQRFYKLLGH